MDRVEEDNYFTVDHLEEDYYFTVGLVEKDKGRTYEDGKGRTGWVLLAFITSNTAEYDSLRND